MTPTLSVGKNISGDNHVTTALRHPLAPHHPSRIRSRPRCTRPRAFPNRPDSWRSVEVHVGRPSLSRGATLQRNGSRRPGEVRSSFRLSTIFPARSWPRPAQRCGSWIPSGRRRASTREAEPCRRARYPFGRRPRLSCRGSRRLDPARGFNDEG